MEHSDGYFDEQVAARYDDPSSGMFRPELIHATVDVLAQLAGTGPALELGIGTGRVALPLTGRGVTVHGIDLSRAMVARMRDKPGGDKIEVTIGDFATASVGGSFTVAYLVFNTIMNLVSQEEQVACFRNVAAHLRPGGCFVVEVMVPELRLLPPGQTIRAYPATPSRWSYDVYDVASQALTSNYLSLSGERSEHRSIPFRYVWPAELDLMARLAGLQLRHRWADWQRAPFTGDSPQHVSIWEKPTPSGS
ncbi:class I SAM-dependent methyltransferase [Actinoplanes sp. NPDC051346]|uniref:class I SAM-dependent DNA methyltransferase n=1 Tax=Actinoplanes sp. NPDC051346 TaxID=3155048 RepID=UPI003414AB7C